MKKYVLKDRFIADVTELIDVVKVGHDCPLRECDRCIICDVFVVNGIKLYKKDIAQITKEQIDDIVKSTKIEINKCNIEIEGKSNIKHREFNEGFLRYVKRNTTCNL